MQDAGPVFTPGVPGDSVRKELSGQELGHTVSTAAKGCHIGNGLGMLLGGICYGEPACDFLTRASEGPRLGPAQWQAAVHAAFGGSKSVGKRYAKLAWLLP